VSEVQVDAGVAESSLASGGQQRVDVQAFDQSDHAIAGAAVTVIVHYRSVDDVYHAPPTNEAGETAVAFTTRQVKKGTTVKVEVRVEFEGYKAKAGTSWKVR
jgi:hypothetical protein